MFQHRGIVLIETKLNNGGIMDYIDDEKSLDDNNEDYSQFLDDYETNDINIEQSASTGTSFEISEETKDKIALMISELKELCIMEKIPMYFSIVEKNNKLGTTYINSCVTPYDVDAVLTDDKISKHILVNNNFYLVPKKIL